MLELDSRQFPFEDLAPPSPSVTWLCVGHPSLCRTTQCARPRGRDARYMPAIAAPIGDDGLGPRHSATSWNSARLAGGYSDLKVIDGSTRAARHAGIQHAIPDTPSSSATTPRYVIGSSRDTPNSSVTRARLATTAPASPRTAPNAVMVIPWRTTSAWMSPRDAPSADLTPISRIRSVTLPESTP